MVNGVNSATINSAYANNIAKSDAKEAARGANGFKNAASQNKVETLKEKIAAGEYTVDLDRLARKMAEELLS